MSHTVLITETVFPDLDVEREVFSESGVEMLITESSTPEEIIAAADGEKVDALLTATHISISEAVFEEIPTLEVVSSYGIGVDHIDLEAANRHGVPVTNVPDYSIEEVSSHAIALLLNCTRSITEYHKHVTEGGWDWEVERPIYRLQGQTLGLVAFGKIARRVAEKLSAFDLEIISYDPYVSESEMAEYSVEKVEFGNLLSRAQLVSTHTPLTPGTRHLFDLETFRAMNDDAVFVNTSRGPVVDEEGLHQALQDGEIDRAAIDVMEEEPPTDSPLLENDDVLITPHAAWYSETSMAELQRKAAEEIVTVLEGQDPRYLVNRDVQSESIGTSNST